MNNEEINRYIHVEIMGKCIHENASRNAANPLDIDCADCDRTLTPREYADENWACRHSEKEPKGGKVRVCKYCGADDVSFDLAIRERPDYCSDDSPRRLLNEVVAKVMRVGSKASVGYLWRDSVKSDEFCRQLKIQLKCESDTDVGWLFMNATAEQNATACVNAHRAMENENG